MSDDTDNKHRYNPPAGRGFRKGNPGRPKGARDKATLAVEALFEGESDAIGRKAIELALAGDVLAIRLILDRICPVRRGRAIVFSMPALDGASDVSLALDSVLHAVADGTLTPDEAVSLAQVIDTRRRAVETLELERRILELEAVLKG